MYSSSGKSYPSLNLCWKSVNLSSDRLVDGMHCCWSSPSVLKGYIFETLNLLLQDSSFYPITNILLQDSSFYPTTQPPKKLVLCDFHDRIRSKEIMIVAILLVLTWVKKNLCKKLKSSRTKSLSELELRSTHSAAYCFHYWTNKPPTINML